jgi:hypothetical protein
MRVGAMTRNAHVIVLQAKRKRNSMNSPNEYTELHKIFTLETRNVYTYPIRLWSTGYHCIACGAGVFAFKDALSMVEFSISQLCQHCQDEVFEPEDDPFFDNDIDEIVWAAKENKDGNRA